MSDDANRPVPDLSTWTFERLEAFSAVQSGQGLEAVRVIAQSNAYRSDRPRHTRLRWAKLSLDANERRHGDDPRDRARRSHQNFALRTWIIERLGPDPDPDWDPEVLAADTLAALTLDCGQAAALAADWRGLPFERIADLRRHKNLTAHLSGLIGFLLPGPTRDRLSAWIEVRGSLP